MKKTIMVFAGLMLSAGCAFAQSSAPNQKKPLVTDKDLVIQAADITENALFYPAVIDSMQKGQGVKPRCESKKNLPPERK